MKVFVVTNVEAGWDCVRGVFGSFKSLANHLLEDRFDEDEIDKMIEAGYSITDLERDISRYLVIHHEYLQ